MQQPAEGGGGLVSLFQQWGEVLLAFGLGYFFGIVRYLQDFLATPRPPFEWLIFTIKGVTAGAVGLLAGWACREWALGPNFTAFVVATVGYGGAEFMNIFKEALREFFIRKVGATGNEPPKP